MARILEKEEPAVRLEQTDGGLLLSRRRRNEKSGGTKNPTAKRPNRPESVRADGPKPRRSNGVGITQTS